MKNYTTKAKYAFITLAAVLALASLSAIVPSAHAAGSNLIVNANLNTADPANSKLPQYWLQGNWGTNTTTFTYPVTGGDGTPAAKVAITSYTSGDSKWYFQDVPVTAATSYQFGVSYTSTVPGSVVAQITKSTGAVSYVDIGSLPASAAWTTYNATYKTPANATSITIFVLINQVGSLTVDNYSFANASAQAGPTVSITAPANGATVSGTATLSATATASASTTIAGVTFKLDGVQLGSEDTTAPYSITSDTTAWTNGSHTLSAIARDSAGLTSTASINITAQNSSGTTTQGTNLISNPSVETVSATSPSLPQDWSTDKWGTNTTTFTYPVAGFDGSKAVQVKTTAYTSGDAKWYFKDVSVQPGVKYNFSEAYTSTALTDIVAQYTSTSGTVTYADIASDLPVSSTWKQVSYTVTPPANTASMTVLHIIYKVGTLTTDNFSLTAPVASDTQAPTVSVVSPIANATVSGTTSFSANASDNVGVKSVQFYLDSVAFGSPFSAAPYQLSVDTTTLGNGTHSLFALASDAAGNKATSSVVSFIVSNTIKDTTAPTVSIPTPNGITVGGTTTLAVNASDNIAVQNVQFSIDGANVGSPVSSAPYQMSFDTTSVQNGVHTLVARAIDTSGNVSTSSPASFTVSNTVADNTAPTISVSTPADNSTFSGTIHVIANATDNVKVASIRLTDLSNFDVSTTSTSADFIVDTTQFPNGFKNLQVIAYDSSNNSNLVTLHLTISNTPADTIAPSVTITSPNDNSTATATVAFISNAYDNVAVSNVQYFVDGAQYGSPLTTNPYAVSYPSTAFANGPHTVYARATDTSGNFATSSTMHFTIVTPDTQAPTISLTSPLANAIVTGTITLSADASDNVKVSAVGFEIDGNLVGNPITAAPYQLSFDTTTLANGLHTLFAIADDSSGNSTSTNPISFNVANGDIVAPTVAIASPADASTATGTLNVLVNASDDVSLATIQLSVDGKAVGTVATSSPASFSLDTTLYPNGAHAISAVAHDASGNAATSTVNVTFNNVIIDTQAPTIAITSPTASSTLSGTTTITLAASDNVGIQDMHLQIDTELVSVSNVAPYTATIDTTNFANGVHTIKAYASDAAGNIGNATPVNIIVENLPVQATSTNLIANPSLETVSTSSPNFPDQWQNGAWGTNDASFAYPIAGIDGANAAEVKITTYTDGDAKWYFNDVVLNTTQATTYDFSEQYKSSTTTSVVARYTNTDGTVDYETLKTLPAASVWTSEDIHINVSSDVKSITLFHLLDSVGTLDIDNYSFAILPASAIPPEDLFNLGMISLTFDDGWLSQYQNVLPILNAANHMPASFYIITKESQQAVPDNRILNSNLDASDPTSSSTPAYWFVSATGNNNASSQYPAPGENGTPAVSLSMSNYNSGEAEWIFDDTSVIANQNYTYSEDYKATASTTLVVRYTYNTGTTTTVDFGAIPPAADWTHYSANIPMPANLQFVTVYQRLNSNGTLSIDNTDLDRVQVYMNMADAKDIWNQGYEVSAHTQTHPDLTTLTQAQMTQEIAGSRADLQAIGISPLDMFVYPYGSYNDMVVQTVKDAGFTAARGTENGYNLRNTPKYELLIQEIDNTTTFDQIKSDIQAARTNRTWLIFMFHQVDNSNEAFAMTPALFQQMVSYIQSTGMPVVQMRDGVQQMLP